MKTLLVLLIIGLAVPAAATVYPVSITEFAFTPDTVYVAPGDTVQWVNNGAFRHSATSGIGGNWDSIWDSGLLDPTATYDQAFPTVGSYPYYCIVHPLMMTGLVIVSATDLEEGRLETPAAPRLTARPSPFNQSTLVRYETPGPDRVRLEILDVTGRLVRTLEPGGPGAGSARWDGTDGNGREVRAGTYLVRLSQGDRRAITRLIKMN